MSIESDPLVGSSNAPLSQCRTPHWETNDAEGYQRALEAQQAAVANDQSSPRKSCRPHLLVRLSPRASSLCPLLADAVEKGFWGAVPAILIQSEHQTRKIDSRIKLT
jgi:hypothetical protein